MFKKTINAQFLTTINFKIFLDTLGFLLFKLPFLRFWKENEKLKKEFLEYLWLEKNSKIINFYNWRSAIHHCLKILNLEKNDEVIVNSYTCVSVSNAVIQSWAKIKYSEIDDKNLNLDLEKLEKNINEKTKVILFQHTFWSSKNFLEVLQIAKKHNILVIEDCAHSLGWEINNRKLGSFWDFSIFSTGRDKVISSVTWGFLVINNSKYFETNIIPSQPSLKTKGRSICREIEKKLKPVSRTLAIQNLLYNIVAYKSYKTYNFFKLWRVIMFISLKLKLIPIILSPSEKSCNFDLFNYNLPNCLAYLARKELKKVDIYNKNRKDLAKFYYENLKEIPEIKILEFDEKNIYFWFPIFVKNSKKLYSFVRWHWIIFWNFWSYSPIAPVWTNLKNAKYNIADFKVAEKISNEILHLPNSMNINFNDAEKVVKIIKKFYKE